MRHVFIINPAAGQGQAGRLRASIHQACAAAGIHAAIYETEGPGDAEIIARQLCQETCGKGGDGEDMPLRIYACGGDGTLNEVVNGAYGFPFVEVGCIPSGTGNDFIRNFPEKDFASVPAQLAGEARPIDLIRYEGRCDGRQVCRSCINMFNIGFDCNVVDLTSRMKRLPLITGTAAYLSSIVVMLAERKGADMRVEYEDGSAYDGKLLLIAIANGAFCGGGLKGVPRAAVDDGRMDVSLVKNVSRRVFIRLFPKFMKGTHLEEPRLADVIRYSQEETLTISPNNDEMKLCVDGEISKAGPIRMKIQKGALRFIIP